MSTRYQPMRLLRAAMLLGVVLAAGAVTPLAGQQAQDTSRVVPATPARTSAQPVTTTGPRLAPRFQSHEPSLARSNVSVTPSPMAQGRSHTIVISTLVLVLIIVIVVLLVR